MLAAERGAGSQHARRLWPRPRRFRATISRGRAVGRRRRDRRSARLSRRPGRGAACKTATVARRLSAIRQLYRFLYAEGRRKDDPAAVLEGPKRARALPKTLTLAEVDRLLRVAGQTDPRRAVGSAAARGAARLPGRTSLRDRFARLRTGGAAGFRRAPRRPRHHRARQGQQGATGAAQQRRQARDGGLSRARCGSPKGRRQRRRRSRNGCSRRSATAAISPASISPAN